MPIYYVIIIILIIFVVLALLFNLLFNPFVWIIIGALILWSWVKKRMYAKQIEEYNKEFERKTREKKAYYYGNDNQQYTSSNDSEVIDVEYTVVDEKEND